MIEAKRLKCGETVWWEPGTVHKCKGPRTNSPNPKKPFDRQAYQ